MASSWTTKFYIVHAFRKKIPCLQKVFKKTVKNACRRGGNGCKSWELGPKWRLFNKNRSAEYLDISLRFLDFTPWPFCGDVDTHDGWQVCLTCATANLVFRVGLGSRKTNVYLRGERLWYIYVPLKEKKEDLPEVSTIFHDRPVSFSCHCSSFGSMILGEQIVHINEGKGKLALFRTKDNVLLTPPPPPPSPSQLIDFSLFF